MREGLTGTKQILSMLFVVFLPFRSKVCNCIDLLRGDSGVHNIYFDNGFEPALIYKPLNCCWSAWRLILAHAAQVWDLEDRYTGFNLLGKCDPRSLIHGRPRHIASAPLYASIPHLAGQAPPRSRPSDELFERSILKIDESRTSTLCSWRSTYRGALAGERKLLMQRSQNLVSLWLPRHSCFNVASFLFFADVPIHRLDPPWLPLYGSRAET